MSAAFDTLKYAKRMKEVGFTEEQAELQAQVFAEVIETQLATKRDLQDLKTELEAKLGQLEAKIERRLGLAATPPPS